MIFYVRGLERETIKNAEFLQNSVLTDGSGILNKSPAKNITDFKSYFLHLANSLAAYFKSKLISCKLRIGPEVFLVHSYFKHGI